MSQIKSIKLITSKKKEDEGRPDLLKADNIYYTNGNIFVVDKFKYNISTG
jgi:hypothetical protein